MNKLIGITGMMGSGKTTIAKELLKQHPDFIYIDVDEFRRNKLKEKKYQQDLKQKIKKLVHEPLLSQPVLNSYIYSNQEYMNAYKEVLYQHLFKYIAKVEEKTILLDWALIYTDHLENHFDKIIYVKTTKKTRLSRMQHSDLSVEEIEKRWKLQEIPNLKTKQTENMLLVDNNYELPIEKVNNFLTPQLECKFTLPKEGGKAIWEITHQCNYQCSYCIFSCNGKKISQELTTTECFKVIDELVEEGFKHLKITGGEPFLRKDIIKILEYASIKLVTDISTNASMITPTTVELLNHIPLKMIHVSLDGNKIDHESVRGKNTYDRTIQGLQALKKSTNKIRIGTVIHANNENKLEEFIKSCIDTRSAEVIFSIMEPMEGQGKSLVMTKDKNTLVLELETLKKKYQKNIEINYNFKKQPTYIQTCPAGEKFLYINNLGQISPCPWVYEKNKNFLTKNSLKNHTLKELLQEKQMQTFLKAKKGRTCYGKI